MPGKLTITVGIPGSGKTTVAELMQKDNPDDVVLVSRDDLRHLLFRGEGILTNHQENYITKVQKNIVKDALRDDKEVIVHDMNLREKYRNQWFKIAQNLGAGFDIIDLTEVRPITAHERVSDRAADGGRYVPEDVIYDLHKKFIEPLKGEPIKFDAMDPIVFESYVPDLEKPSAIIVDIDGTIASHEGIRGPFDTSRYQYDLPVDHVVKFVQDQHYKLGHAIIFCSGRHSNFRDVTEEWLFQHVKVPFTLFMREDPSRDDSVEKYLLFDSHIRDNYNVQFVLDDRDRVVRMWRGLGLPTYQVEEGDF